MNTEEASKTGCIFRFGFSGKYGMFSQNINRFLYGFRLVIGQKTESHRKTFLRWRRSLKMQEQIYSIFPQEIRLKTKNRKWEECGRFLSLMQFVIRFIYLRLQQETLPILTK